MINNGSPFLRFPDRGRSLFPSRRLRRFKQFLPRYMGSYCAARSSEMTGWKTKWMTVQILRNAVWLFLPEQYVCVNPFWRRCSEMGGWKLKIIDTRAKLGKELCVKHDARHKFWARLSGCTKGCSLTLYFFYLFQHCTFLARVPVMNSLNKSKQLLCFNIPCD